MNASSATASDTRQLPASNRLLDCMPRAERQRFLGHCELVELRFAEILCEPGDRIKSVYFPMNSYISLLAPAGERTSLEAGLIGNEGMLGVARILEIDMSPLRAVVAGSGLAMRMTAALFTRELQGSAALRRQLNRYLYALMAQFAQGGACARYHDVNSRLARWLLTTQDRAHSNHFYFTHEFLASILGVRRVGVTAAAGRLQRDKLINYRRGNIEIVDRRGLEASACECYASIKNTYDRFLR